MASFTPAMVICGDRELGLTSWVGGRVMPSLWQWSKAVGGDGGHVWRLMCGLGWGHPWDLRHWTTMIEQHLNHTFMVLGNGVGVSYFLVNTDLKSKLLTKIKRIDWSLTFCIPYGNSESRYVATSWWHEKGATGPNNNSSDFILAEDVKDVKRFHFHQNQPKWKENDKRRKQKWNIGRGWTPREKQKNSLWKKKSQNGVLPTGFIGG